VKDYDAVMSSIKHLKEMYPLSGWPSKDLTFEQDLIDWDGIKRNFRIEIPLHILLSVWMKVK